MVLTTTRFDMAAHLDSDEAVAEYLTAVLEEGDPIALAQAIGTVARARGMKMIAQEVGVSRESLYKSLSGQGNPSFATVVNVARALGLRLTVATATKAA